MREYINIVEGISETISLEEIYAVGNSPLYDDSEIINQFVSMMDYELQMPIRYMSASEASTRLTANGEPLIDVYNENADDEQKEMIQYKIDHFDNDRIVVLNGDMVLDGNHHIIAAILSDRPFKYVDIREMEER